MKIVVAPDSFKGSLSAAEVASAIAAGVRKAAPDAEVVEVPMADGGEGTVDALVAASGGRLETREVEGPLGAKVQATFGMLGDGKTAVIEMAAASGLPLVSPAHRDPTETSTYGTGQLLRAALDLGASEILLGIGGSATNDCGCGMAQALGILFRDKEGHALERVTGGRLLDVARIEVAGRHPGLGGARVRVACDVDNPLYGRRGAAQVFAPQKGATPAQVEMLDAGLRHLAKLIRRDLALDVVHIPGAGAAGGLGAGLVAFCGGRLEPGIGIVIEAARLREKMAGADLCITGEGKLDSTTRGGKTPAGVAKVAREAGALTVGIAGAVDLDSAGMQEVGLAAAFSLLRAPVSLEEAMKPSVAAELLTASGEQIVSLFLAARGAR